MAALSSQQITTFLDQGYLSIGKLLDDELVDQLREEYDRLFTEAREDGRYRNLAISDTDDTAEKRTAKGQMLQIMQMGERSLLYRRLLYDDRILDIVESLMGPNIQLFHDQALFKPAHNGEAVFGRYPSRVLCSEHACRSVFRASPRDPRSHLSVSSIPPP